MPKRPRTHLKLIACAAALVLATGCVTRVNAPTVRPSWIEAPEGDWDEVLIHQSYTTILTRYRADSLRVDGVRRTRTRRADKARDFLRRRVERRDTVDVAYRIAEAQGFRAQVLGTFVQYSDISRSGFVLRFGNASDDDDAPDDRTYHRLAYASDLRLRIGDDSTAWRLSTSWEWDSTGIQRSERMLTRNDRTLALTELVPNGKAPEPSRRTPMLVPEAAGWLVLDGKTPLAAVQTSGGGLLGQSDLRAWVPRGLDAAERKSRIAMLLMLLEGSNRSVFTRQH
ncbi:MAG: hypothetical protein KF689_11400 [Gemmatimonadaceae bacterium]|nr:hypothetical protein [Gemmatimonadaceae bacterium]MCW5825798.1 hypothetical protein [Gemmatimonadaceae bacterium]